MNDLFEELNELTLQPFEAESSPETGSRHRLAIAVRNAESDRLTVAAGRWDSCDTCYDPGTDEAEAPLPPEE